MLKQILEATRLDPAFCAEALRVPLRDFQDWLDQKQPLPRYVVAELCNILGVDPSRLTSRVAASNAALIAPAVWFKLRDERLMDADRRTVALIRRLGYAVSQFERISEGQGSAAWNALSQAVLGRVDRSAPPADQGQNAAIAFRAALGLEHGQKGVGEILRPLLRRRGLLLIESPISKSGLEGCTFAVGARDFERPCVFVNTFRSTWFRRNEIILHEVCHAIFDLANDQVSLDFRGSPDEGEDFAEVRARFFSQNVLVPKSVLVHCQNRLGMKWHELTAENIAHLIAETHAEQRTVLRAALAAGLIDQPLFESYLKLDCASHLKAMSERALMTHEFLSKLPQQKREEIAFLNRVRKTTLGRSDLRLPISHIQRVLTAVGNQEISPRKGAELLLMEPFVFEKRFRDLLPERAA